MTDYSKKKCVVCGTTGAIAANDGGLYVCGNCGTPYRPRRKTSPITARAKQTPPAETPDSTTTSTDRFVWFTFTQHGTVRHGLYDCPILPETDRPTLHLDRNRLHFWKYLVEKGHLTGDTEARPETHSE